MSAYRFATLTCDECGQIWDEQPTTRIAEARRIARTVQRWTNSGNQDWCRRCSRDRASAGDA